MYTEELNLQWPDLLKGRDKGTAGIVFERPDFGKTVGQKDQEIGIKEETGGMWPLHANPLAGVSVLVTRQ